MSTFCVTLMLIIIHFFQNVKNLEQIHSEDAMNKEEKTMKENLDD